MPVALVYVRRSVNRSGESTVSPEKQREACLAVCESHDWTYELFEDLEGWRSGRFEATRPAWLKLKERLRQGGIAAVVVYRLDRASRSPKDFFNFMGLLQEHHADLVSATQDIDTSTPYGRMFIGLLSLWAALEAEITSERIRETVAWKQGHGIHVGDVPLGYDRTKQTIDVNGERVTTSILSLNEADAKIVKDAFTLYATGQYSYRTLADELNARGYRSRHKSGRRNPFDRKGVQTILENAQLYQGLIVRHEGQLEEEIVQGVHPAIVDADLARRVQHQAAAWHNRIPRRYAQQRNFILPNLHCAICGGALKGITERRNGHAVYRHTRVKGDCPVQQAPADTLEASLLEVLSGLTFSPEELAHLERRWAERGAPEQGQQQKGESYLAQREQRAKRLYLAGDLTEREYAAEKASVARQREKLRQEQTPALSAHQLLVIVQELGGAIRHTDPQHQRSMIDALCERLETNGEEITRIVPRHWFASFFADLKAVQGCVQGYPQGTLNQQLDALIALFDERPVSPPVARNVIQADRNTTIRQLRQNNIELAVIARQYGISVQRVWEICRGNRNATQ